MFNQIIYTCLVIFGLSLLIGGTYELYQYFKRKGLRRERTLNNFTLKSLKREETMLEKELEQMLKGWDKHLLSLMSAYSIEGMFKKSSTTFPDIILKLSPYKRTKVSIYSSIFSIITFSLHSHYKRIKYLLKLSNSLLSL